MRKLFSILKLITVFNMLVAFQNCGRFEVAGLKTQLSSDGPGFVQKDLNLCKDTNVRHLRRPIDPSKTGGASFDYAYQYIRAETDPGSAVTIVMIPGGPGQGFIGFEKEEGLPSKKYNWILIDPRGIQCNALNVVRSGYTGSFPLSFYSTALHVDDVAAVIGHAGIANQKYLVYGISYGSVVATRLARRIEERRAQDAGYPEPLSVVLEGTFSQFSDGKLEAARRVQYWNTNVLPYLSPASRNLLTNPSLTEEDELSLSAMATSAMNLGFLPGRGEETVLRFDQVVANLTMVNHARLAIRSSPFALRGLDEACGEESDSVPAPFTSAGELEKFCEMTALVKHTIHCRELDPESIDSFRLRGANASTQTENLRCADLRQALLARGTMVTADLAGSEKWDSAAFKAPYDTIYFQGYWDGATPREHSVRHFNLNTRANRVKLEFPRYSHTPLMTQAKLVGCFEEYMDAAVGRSPAGFLEASNWCFDGRAIDQHKPTQSERAAGG